ncbi:MAG: FtsQ-type POTRA domain-containing protein [Armatimonadetes bacterium]|nr:FtsQ-type POTRA domain-containing protein [Armatimonadota bacterium]
MFLKMWLQKVLILLIACMFIPQIAFAQEKQITEIVVTGNDRISKDAILAAISLKPGMAFSESEVQAARDAIQNMGYFERVTVGTESVDSGVKVIFSVVENPVVKEIKITGNTAIPTEKILSLMRTSVGSVLNINTLEQDIEAIRKYYTEKRYIATVTEQVGIDPATGVLTIPIQEARVEAIKIVGNKKTKTYVILREMKLKPGDVFNGDVLAKDIMRIYDLGIFDRESPEPYRLEAGSDVDKVVVIIPVKELKTGEVSLGVGYSSKTGLVGQARVSESNFRGRGQAVSILGEIGGSDNGNSYEVSFYEPWLDVKHTSLGVNVYSKFLYRFSSNVFGVNGDDEYDERRKGGSVTLSRPLSEVSRGFVTLRSESVDIPEFSTLPAAVFRDGTVTSGTLRLTNDYRDSVIEPFTGNYISYAVELGKADLDAVASAVPPLLASNSTFAKYSIDFRRYISKGGPRTDVSEQRRVLAIRLMAGSLSGDVPFFEQYFVGGAETLRGYREDRFWGKNMFLLSTEYRFPLAPSLKGVAFVDYGDAWGADEQFLNINLFGTEFAQHKDFSPKVGYGVGIRVVTPIGLLRLDYGFSDEGSRAHFSIGHAF